MQLCAMPILVLGEVHAVKKNTADIRCRKFSKACFPWTRHAASIHFWCWIASSALSPKVGKARHPAKFLAAAQKNGKLWCRDVGPACFCNNFCLHVLAEYA